MLNHKARSVKKGISRSHYQLYLLLLPGLVYLIVYKYTPILGLVIAFKDFGIFAGNNTLDSIVKSPWVGFYNFTRLFACRDFLKVFSNTLVISVYKLVFLFPLPILLALFINELRWAPYKKTVQTLLYLPHFISWVIVYGVFFSLLSNNGIVNQLLDVLGLDRVNFFTDSSKFRSLLVFTDGWKEAGWGTIIYLAALTGIDTGLYEASRIDGANRMQQMVHVTLPGILPVVMLMLIIRVGNILNAGFDQILVMYNPVVYDVADIIDTYVYRMGLGKLDFSLGTALGVFNSVTAFVLIVSSNALCRRTLGRSIW